LHEISSFEMARLPSFLAARCDYLKRKMFCAAQKRKTEKSHPQKNKNGRKNAPIKNPKGIFPHAKDSASFV